MGGTRFPATCGTPLPIPEPVKSALEGAGISTSSLDSIRLARGFVGKASYVAGIALLALGAAALRGGDTMVVSFLMVAVFTVYFLGALWFAHRHPGEALLEGAELIKWRQMEIGAKDITVTPSLTVNTAAPTAIEHQPMTDRG
jgi:hypothetical protein